LKFKADPKVQDKNGVTALHLLVFRFDRQNQQATRSLVTLLLKHQADPGAQLNNGMTALYVLAGRFDDSNQQATLAVAKQLLTKGADPRVKDKTTGRTALHELVGKISEGNQEVIMELVKKCLKHKADLMRAQDNEGATVLHYLINNLKRENQEASLRFLNLFLKCGADPNAQTRYAQTVLNVFPLKPPMCRRINVWRELAMLLDRGANPTIDDCRGVLPLDTFKDHERFDPTSVFLLIRSMLVSGF